jgi:hypothetical protein
VLHRNKYDGSSSGNEKDDAAVEVRRSNALEVRRRNLEKIEAENSWICE